MIQRIEILLSSFSFSFEKMLDRIFFSFSFQTLAQCMGAVLFHSRTIMKVNYFGKLLSIFEIRSLSGIFLQLLDSSTVELLNAVSIVIAADVTSKRC